MYISFNVLPEEQEIKLSLFLRRKGISSALIKTVKYIENGILVNNVPAKTNQIVHESDVVEFLLPEDEKTTLEAEQIPVTILYECQDFLAIDKPMGMVMHPTRTHKNGTLGNAYMGLMQGREQLSLFRPVGRLDAGTSGVVICALSQYATLFLAKKMKKVYLAVVKGFLPKAKGSITQPIGKSDTSVIEQVVRSDGKESCTEYETLASNQNASLVAVWPKTGRTHQIRIHFSWLGHPLLGDTLYGNADRQQEKSYHLLHCACVQVSLPSEKVVCVSAPVPDAFKDSVSAQGLIVDWEKIQEVLQIK